MKKSLPFLLTMSLAVTIFSGCSTDDSENTDTTKDASAQETAEAKETPERGNEKKDVEKTEAEKASTDSAYTKIDYGSESASQKIDIHTPENEKGPYPVIIAVQGSNDAEEDNHTLLERVNEGYAVVQVPSGSTDEDGVPEVTNETEKAIQFVSSNAVEYNLDAGNMEVWGYSAAGQAEKLDVLNEEKGSNEESKTEDFEYVPINY